MIDIVLPSDQDRADNEDLDRVCEYLEEVLEERDELESHIERLDNELQSKALSDDGVLADAYWNCADTIAPWLGEETGPDTLINSVCGSLNFLIDQWREKTALEQERDVLAERAEAAEALAIEWQQRHVDLYLASEEARNRANDAEGKLTVLQYLLRKATGIAGGDDGMTSEQFDDDEPTLYAGNFAAQPKYWRNK